MSDLADYYRDRATEYDAVYAKPERQEDLARLRALLPPPASSGHMCRGPTYDDLPRRWWIGSSRVAWWSWPTTVS
ncbi:hypothetical protein AB0E63_10015 [Kribbella sp. NPDC026596]|uniref:hypothetical protein n=1 Tax=Kribbella sp. NPDC026596 TaxID=3155122 RepID=UPI0033D0C5E7